MKFSYLILISITLGLLSFSKEKSKKCHIHFDLSPKFKKTTDSQNGDHRIYYDARNLFSLEVNKFNNEDPANALKDSIQNWVYDKDLLEETFSNEKEMLEYNNLEIQKYSYTEKTNEHFMFHT